MKKMNRNCQKNRGSALFVAIVVIFLISTAVIYSRYRNSSQNAAVSAAVGSTVSGLTGKASVPESTRLIINSPATARAAASVLRGRSTAAVSSAGTVNTSIPADNEMVAKNLEQLAADFSLGAASDTSVKGSTASGNAGTAPVASSIRPQAWPTDTDIVVALSGTKAQEVFIETPTCLQTIPAKNLKTAASLTAALQAEIKNNGICSVIATAHSIITAAELPPSQWSGDEGTTISADFLAKVLGGALNAVDPVNKPGKNVAAGQKMHENFPLPEGKKFVCQAFQGTDYGADKLCDYINQAQAPGLKPNCSLVVGNSTARKGHAMDVISAKMGQDGKCKITTRSTDANQQGDANGQGVPAPGAANKQIWSIPTKGSPSLVGGDPEPSDTAKNEVANLKFDVGAVQCCFVRNAEPAAPATKEGASKTGGR